MENEKILKIGLSIVGGLLLILLIPFILFYSFIFLIMIIYGFAGQGPFGLLSGPFGLLTFIISRQGPFGQLSFIICPSIIILPLLILIIYLMKRDWIKEKFNIK